MSSIEDILIRDTVHDIIEAEDSEFMGHVMMASDPAYRLYVSGGEQYAGMTFAEFKEKLGLHDHAEAQQGD